MCLAVSSCGGNSVNKPTLMLNAENYSADAMQAYDEENWIRAQRLFNQALALYQSIDNRTDTLITHINLVEVALAKHDSQVAQRHLTLATDIVQTDGLKSYQSRIALLNALMALQQKQMIKTIHFLNDLLPEFKDEIAITGINAIQLAAIAIRTEIAFQQKNKESLWTLRYGNALKKSANKNTALEARLLRFQSRLLLQQGDYEKSTANLQQALKIYKKNLSRSDIAATLLEIGMLYEKQSDWQRTLNYFKRSIAVFSSIRNTEKVNKVTAMLAKVKSAEANSALRINPKKSVDR